MDLIFSSTYRSVLWDYNVFDGNGSILKLFECGYGLFTDFMKCF